MMFLLKLEEHYKSLASSTAYGCTSSLFWAKLRYVGTASIFAGAPHGHYKVPSLKGVWYRSPFEHNGSVATLEDWFDPKRLRDDYVPTGFKGYGVKTQAVKGHEFGLRLSPEDKRALIAFLKTL